MRKQYILFLLLIFSFPVFPQTVDISDEDEITEDAREQVENIGKKIRNMRNAARRYSQESEDIDEVTQTRCISGKQIATIIGGIATIVVTLFKAISMIRR